MDKTNYFQRFEDYRKENIIVSPNSLFVKYLHVLYPNLVLREYFLSEENDIKAKLELPSYEPITNKSLSDKQISVYTFTQYLGIQNLISERIFKYIDKSKKGTLSKNDFSNGLYQLFYGNTNELTKLTFFICDFNEDGKIFKSDMKLILAYIPNYINTAHSNQQEFIKEINKQINEFFIDINKNNTIQGDNLEEIDYNLYHNKVLESIKSNVINGAFFLFINLIKYIFKNKPFNKETIYTINYVKNKYLLRATVPKDKESIFKRVNLFQKNPQFNSNIKILNLNNAELNSNSNRIKDLPVRTDKKSNLIKKYDKNYNLNLSKFQRKDLFKIKTKSSAIIIEDKYPQKFESKKHDYIIAKEKDDKIVEKEKKEDYNDDFNKIINEIDSKNKVINRNQSTGRITGKNLSFHKVQSSEAIMPNRMNSNKLQNNKKILLKSIDFTNKVSNHKPKNEPLPQILNTPKKMIIKNNYNVTPDFKLKTVSKTTSPRFIIQNEFRDHVKVSNFIEELNNNINNNIESETSCYLFKYTEEENHISMKKYFAVLNKKEILFYSSNLKNELCTIWNCNDSVVCLLGKTSISKFIFYPIKIIYKNGIYSFLFFDSKDSQNEFGNQLKKNINNLNFEDEYETKEVLGEGHFACVKRCIEIKSGKEYAVKIISKKKLSRLDADLIIREKNYMKTVKHPNIVSLIGDFEDENYIYFVMEYYKGGDLYAYIYEHRKNKKDINEHATAKIIKILAQCIQYLNHFGIIHRDLKPENIVFSKKNDLSSLILIDLGVSITLSYGQTSSEPIGTLEYISPEIFTRSPYGHKVDVWSLGIILYILITSGRYYPFDCDSKDKDERDKIIGKKIVFLQQEYPENIFGGKSKYLINLIDKSLEKSPEKRITIDEFLDNYWLVNYSK